MCRFSLVALAVDFLVPLKHQIVSFLGGLGCCGHFFVSRLLRFHCGCEHFPCCLEFGVTVLTGFHLLDLSADFLHALHDLSFVVSSVASTLEFVFEAAEFPAKGVDRFWWLFTASTSLARFNRSRSGLWALCCFKEFLGGTNLSVCFLASGFLFTNDFVHLLSDFTLFAHLHDEFSNFSIQIVAISGECLRFIVPFVTDCSVTGGFAVYQFASLFELSFEFGHSLSHLFSGRLPSSHRFGDLAPPFNPFTGKR